MFDDTLQMSNMFTDYQGDAWICMELLNTSLDKFYKFVTGTLHQSIPEDILGKITLATVKALSYLKEKLKIIHRGRVFKRRKKARKQALNTCLSHQVQVKIHSTEGFSTVLYSVCVY